uniref:Portal protein n=1 Tax=Micrococcus phage Kurnik TaxID=3092208 RepID=A0AAU6R640_9CAUD
MATGIFTPYSTAVPFFAGSKPDYATDDDAERIQAYQTYEEIYWGESTVGVEVEDGAPINVPIAKVVVEAIHRFLAVGWNFSILGADPDDKCKLAFTKLFKREQIQAKVSTGKRYGLIRGDAILHVIADPRKAEGTRISIEELDPASYFPIYELSAPDKILGCHIVDQITDADDKVVIRRLTYRKEFIEDDSSDEPVFTGVITSETAIYETAGWDDRFGAKPEDIKLIRVIAPEEPLPAQITALPVYHWKATRNPGDLFGSSVLRGIEKVLKSIDQTITDQDLALALASLGVYATDGGPPEEGAWAIGPGRVIEHSKDSKFIRVPGITSITPSLEHVRYLEEKARSGVGVPAVAAGDVDVSTAESGIALALKLMPLMAANAERELEMISVLDHLLYDLQTMWFPAYEGLSFGEEILVESSTKDPMPVNRQAVIDEVVQLLEAGLITLQMAVDKLKSVGWDYPENAIEDMLLDSARRVKVTDPFAARLEMRDAQSTASSAQSTADTQESVDVDEA